MRILELRTPGAPEPGVEFHPNFTVVNGLSASARERVIDVIAALPAGTAPSDLEGLLEAHGVLFDLSDESLRVFGLAGADLDVAVRALDLPSNGNGSGATSSPSVPLFADGADAGGVDAGGVDGGNGAEPVPAPVDELERLRTAHDDAVEAYGVMSDALERAKLERAAVGEARQRVMTALDKARRNRDLARSRLEGKPAGAGGDREQELADQVSGLRSTVEELELAIQQLEETDPRPIQVLLDALREPQSTTMVPSAEANALADEFGALQAQLDDLERRLQNDGLSMDQLSQRLEDARFEVKHAERAMEKPDLTGDDVQELEKAHDAVLEAEKRASGRIGRKAAMAQLDEAREQEQAILDRVGFPTWSAYVMGSSLLNIDPIAEQRVEQSRKDLETAEALWEDLTHRLEETPEYAELLDRLEAVYLAAFDILSGDTEGDLEARLRQVVVPDEEVSRQDLVDALIYQLGLRGVELEDLTPEDVVAGMADDWLAETSEHWVKYRALQEAHLDATNELAMAERELETAGGDPDQDTPEARQEKFEAAEQRVTEILSDLEQANQIESELEGQVEARQMLLEPTRMAMDSARASFEAAGGDPDAGPAPEPGPGSTGQLPDSYDRNPEVYDDLPYAAEDDDGEGDDDEDGESLEFYFLARLASLRSVSPAGSVPMVIDDALAGLPGDEVTRLLVKLESMTDAVQVIYLSDDPDVSGWADGLGLARAAVVVAQGQFAS